MTQETVAAGAPSSSPIRKPPGSTEAKHGHEGTAAAGHVIEAFGNFVMSGNFVIGIIVFAILVIVNFVVITKGSGRIAEVAARFQLDSMPGKQMAIDADLSAGLIDEKTAKARRKELEDESGFFGAMASRATAGWRKPARCHTRWANQPDGRPGFSATRK